MGNQTMTINYIRIGDEGIQLKIGTWKFFEDLSGTREVQEWGITL